MKVGYVHFYGLGDNIATFDALYGLKKIFNATVIVFGNVLMKNLLQYSDFVDEVYDIVNMGGIEANIELINTYNFDYVILTNCKRCFLRPLEKTNAKRIITTAKIASLFSFKCQTIPFYLLPKYRKMCSRDYHLELVRKIDSKIYDKAIKSFDFSGAKIQVSKQHQERIQEFLSSVRKTYNEKLIFINPFSYSTSYSLSQEGFLLLMERVSKLDSCIVIVATYPDVHNLFLQTLQDSCRTINNLAIFHNDNDVLNLAALLGQMDVVISPSTGTIHMASNLGIKTIGLFSQYDTIKWSTRDQCYVIISKTIYEINANEEQEIIDETLRLLYKLLYQPKSV